MFLYFLKLIDVLRNINEFFDIFENSLMRKNKSGPFLQNLRLLAHAKMQMIHLAQTGICVVVF